MGETFESDEDFPAPVRTVLRIIGAGISIYSLWCTYVAFAGGRLPIVGWHLDGGVGTGITWVLLADPVLLSVGYLFGALIALPLGAIFRGRP